MSNVKVITGGYMQNAFKTMEQLRREAEPVLSGEKFDTMVGTGLSGALVVPRLAEAFGVHWLIVRKPGDGSHSNHQAEGTLGRRWIFVDDFVSTGNTWKRVMASMAGIDPSAAYAGTYSYRDRLLVLPGEGWWEERYAYV